MYMYIIYLNSCLGHRYKITNYLFKLINYIYMLSIVL